MHYEEFTQNTYKKPHHESKKGALSRNLSVKRCKNKCKKVHYEEFTQNTYKKPHHESKEGALSRNLTKNLKATNKASLRVY